jgi:hypothetical protein
MIIGRKRKSFASFERHWMEGENNMFICPNAFCISQDLHSSNGYHEVVMIYSYSETFEKAEKEALHCFVRIVKTVIEELNKTIQIGTWALKLINVNNKELKKDCETLYNADIAIVECTRKDANVFYMLGMAHALGCLVCPCFRADTVEEKAEGNTETGKKAARDTGIKIPFDVHGRQSLIYRVVNIEDQEDLKEKLINWINHCIGLNE